MNRIIAAAICTMCIAGCGSTSDINTVKNGVLDFNKTLTIGQALDNWKNCKNSEWNEFTSDNGVKVVQFTCNESLEEYMGTLQSFIPQNHPFSSALPNADTKTFQFTMNKDGTFQLDNVSDLTKWPDGTENEQSQNPTEQIKSAYRNKMDYDMSDLAGLQKGNSDSQAAAEMLLTAYAVGKAGGKKSASSGTTQETPQEPTSDTTPPESPAATARTLTDSNGVQYTVKDAPTGKLLESTKANITLGPSCTASSPQYGQGKWGWANGGVNVEFSQTTIGFPREETPYDDGRCAL